jgi:outer membrane lipoprotein LolB
MRRVFPLITTVALLSACASAPTTPSLPGRAVDPSRVAEWVASGRLAVAVGREGGSGSFTWRQHAAVTDLQVRGPFGAGALQIVVDGDSVTVTDAAGVTLDSSTARERIRARLGADLPLAELRYWVLGLAAPGSQSHVEQRAQSPLRIIEQAGWNVSYQQFRAAAGWLVPARLTASSGSASIRIIVDDWHLPPAGEGPDVGVTSP